MNSTFENNENLAQEKKKVWTTPSIELLGVKHTQGGFTTNDPESQGGIWS